MITKLPTIVDEYVRAINQSDAAAYVDLFTKDAVVDDGGRIFQGRTAIAAWSKTDIFDVQVSLEVLAADEREGQTVLTTKVDGNFDRTGLPDPVVIDHYVTIDGARIAALTCKLAD